MPNIKLPHKELTEFCRRWQVQELSLFGSVLTEAFNENSDIDMLVKFSKDARRTLFDVVTMECEMQDMLKRKVDLVMKDGIAASKNIRRKNEILSSAKVVYRDE